jgi:hypothetical protein
MLPASRQGLRPELLAGFGFEALVVNGLRRRIRGADLARDLFAERHAGDEARAGRIQGRGLPRPERRVSGVSGERCPNTGESSAGDQTVARGVGGIIAIHFADVFDAAIVAH